jgi:putative hemolysin secretion transport system ATP-binding protein
MSIVFPEYRQFDSTDCGPACLKMISQYYGKNYSLQSLRERCFISRQGVSMLGISDAAESIGFRTRGVKLSLQELIDNKPYPCIIHWNQNHFVVCYGSSKHGRLFKISDPARGKYEIDRTGFEKCWLSMQENGKSKGNALLLEPTPTFYEQKEDRTQSSSNLAFYLRYLKPYRSQIVQLFLGMLCSIIFALVLPFLTQAVVDQGIENSNLEFVTLVLVAQLILMITRMSVSLIQNWIMLNMNTRISIALISDFLAKLMRLPLRIFDTKNIGDILQRIDDHSRIQSFMTGTALTSIFSLVSFFIFIVIMANYNLLILTVFLIGNILYVLWILLFMRYRRRLDNARFAQASANQSSMVEIITGMQEIKLNNIERQQRWKWEAIQVGLFKISIKSMTIGQLQQMGSLIFSQSTSIIISFLSAKFVIQGTMTLGMMMAISYIIGQLSGPVGQFIELMQSFQDASISLERLNEINQRKDETIDSNLIINEIPNEHTLRIENVSFSYDGSERNYVLEHLSLTIPSNKVTAIVGSSGSGKTTIIKLLMGFYKPQKGIIKVGSVLLDTLNPHLWRQNIGAVLQDGFLLSDTIAKNIAMTDNIDKDSLWQAADKAQIREYIERLPLGYNTKIGMEGSGLSQGQKQRLLIARAIYKNPDFVFFDEATNALDANNERNIMEALENFYNGKTVIVAAHRLSTIRNADHIIVLDHGKIVEEGNHNELIAQKGIYYGLIKNQLELGL